MTTCASPTQGSKTLAIWRVDMAPAVAGPHHSFGAEQVWTVLAGSVTVELDGKEHTTGDTVVMPAGTARRIHADAEKGSQ